MNASGKHQHRDGKVVLSNTNSSGGATGHGKNFLDISTTAAASFGGENAFKFT